MKGALVFLAVFAIAVILTLGNTSIPPGQMIYNAFLPGTEAASGYMIAGSSVNAVTAIIAVFNGVIYGFIAWLIFTIIMMATGKNKEKQNINQTVHVNVNGNNPQSPPPPPPQ
jgi:hypothetical protein